MTRRNDDHLDWYRLPPADVVLPVPMRIGHQSKPDGAGAKPTGRAPFVRYPVAGPYAIPLYPVEVIYRMGEAKYAGTAKLYPLLLHLSWKADHRPFKLLNGDLRRRGLSREQEGSGAARVGADGVDPAQGRTSKGTLDYGPYDRGGDQMKSVSSTLQCWQLRLTDFAPSVRSRRDTVSVLYFLLLGVLEKQAVGTPRWEDRHATSTLQQGRRKADARSDPHPRRMRAMVDRVSVVPGPERSLLGALPAANALS
jgi:hypothetical protein